MGDNAVPEIASPDHQRCHQGEPAEGGGGNGHNPLWGDRSAAWAKLRASLNPRESDLILAEKLIALRDSWLSEQLNSIVLAAHSEAILRLRQLLTVEPTCLQAAEKLIAVQRAHIEELVSKADPDSLRTALEIDPFHLEARRMLVNLQAQLSKTSEEEAAIKVLTGDLDSALVLLEAAQSTSYSTEREQRIQRIILDKEFTDGKDFYQDRRYDEAIFQFRKVLLKDSKHAEAQRLLQFAESFAKGSSSEDLSERFRMLE